MDQLMEVRAPAEYLIEDKTKNNRTHVVVDDNKCLTLFDDKCPHRGGPLHLALKDPNGDLICPWHGKKVCKRKKAINTAAVYIVSTGSLRIVNPDSKNGDHWGIRRLSKLQRVK